MKSFLYKNQRYLTMAGILEVLRRKSAVLTIDKVNEYYSIKVDINNQTILYQLIDEDSDLIKSAKQCNLYKIYPDLIIRVKITRWVYSQLLINKII